VPDMSDPKRDAIYEVIAKNGTSLPGAVLTGWVVVAEWMDVDGEQWLSTARCASTTNWAGNGMLHEVLYGDWPDRGDPP
jgi:hypothetical protein